MIIKTNLVGIRYFAFDSTDILSGNDRFTYHLLSYNSLSSNWGLWGVTDTEQKAIAKIRWFADYFIDRLQYILDSDIRLSDRKLRAVSNEDI